jgi:hypothetical protein
LDYEVAYVEGLIKFPEPDATAMEVTEDSKDFAAAHHQEEQKLPYLDELPEEQSNGHNVVFIGELKLADFKQVLGNAGYRADFQGGKLVTADGTVVIKKV